MKKISKIKAKKDVGHGGLDEWFSGHGGAKGKGEKATWGDWVAISPVEKTLSSGKKVKPGDIVGPCGISDDPDWKSITNNGKDPLKCMPRPKAHKMPKKERAEKAKAKMRAEKKDKDKGKKPTLTPTFEKEKKASMNVYKTLDSVPLDSSTWASLVSKTPAWLDRDYPFVPQPDETCTVKELAYLARLAKLRARYAGFIKAADKDILGVFKSLCAKLGVVAPWDALKKRTNDVAILVTKLKWSYNRPRPYQAALKYGVNFKPMSSVSAHSPAYPSGHTVQSFVLANDLASFAPQHRHAFLKLAEKISASRMIAGYHFPSDIQFGRTIFQNIAMPAMPASMKYAKAEKYKHINFKPPQSVAKSAERGLEYRRKAKPSDRGGLTVQEAAKEGIGSGVQRASNLKNRSNVSPKVIKQMVAFFSRHEKNKAIGPENRGTPWKDKGHVAWLLWGGDPGKAWANKVLRQMKAADEKEKKRGKTARDEGLGEGDKEASDLFKSRARLASRFVTDRSGRKHKLPRYLYQVTYLKDLDSIQSSGIRAGRGQTFGGGYGGHSAGRVFFADEDGVGFWFQRYGEIAENKTDNPEDGWWPVVLRVPTSKIKEEFNYDSPGSKDSYSLSVFVEPERGISSNIIEVFDPFSGSWTSLDSVDVDDWLDEAQSEGAEEESDGEDSWVIVDFDYFTPY